MRMLVETPPTLWPVGAREHVRSVTETSLKCLNFGLNSRAWLQQATAAQYWTHVKRELPARDSTSSVGTAEHSKPS